MDKKIYSEYADLSDNIQEASQKMKKGDLEARNAESRIYDMQLKAMLAMDKQAADIEREDARLELERNRIEQELELKRKELEMRTELEKDTAKTQKWASWSKVALAGLEVVLTAGLGLLTLKYNMEFGGLVGRDGQNWFKEIKKIKPN